MKTYEVIFNEKQDKGIYAVSLVESPAMEGMFIALSEDKKTNVPLKFSTIDEEQRILLGVALIPNKPILRLTENNEEFQIVFSSETIKNAAHSFLKNGYNSNSSLEHETKLKDVSFVESWIIEDDKQDKSRAYGINEPVGSWMLSMKVDSDEVWNEYVKTGAVKGFSIDGLFSLKEIENKTELNMSEQTEAKNSFFAELKADFKAFLEDLKPEKKEEEEVKLGKAMLKDGSATIMYDGESLAEGVAVFIEADGEMMPLPQGEYTLEDDMIIIVSEEGIVSEIQELIGEVDAELSNEEFQKEMAKILESYKASMSKIEEIEKDLEDQKTANIELSKKNDELEAKLAKQPAAKPIVHADKPKEQIELNANGRLLAKLRNLKEQ